VVRSANDVAFVIAENVGGSEQKFIKAMTERAKQLGMSNTNFTNASGWHDPKQVSTAADMARLYMALRRDFPQYHHFCSKTSFMFKGKKIHGHNRVMANYPGATAGKTGFTNPAGFNLVIEATRNGKRLLGVVTGSPSWASRDKKMAGLLDHHFGVKHENLQGPKNKTKTKRTKARVKVASGATRE
jgi:D-alanyl-D-alanine carboxypeptidase (penicillin-binding protein 5/6)